MIKLKADFEADLVRFSREELIRTWDVGEATLEDRNTLIYYVDSLRRRIQPQQRRLEVAADFECPPNYEAGWALLQQKIALGENLNPHLSTRHGSLFNRDGLLNEWNVHHFHLGSSPHPKAPDYVDRTGPLVFARVTDEVVYAIGVFTHGGWEDQRILESLHRNWPDSIRHYRLNGVHAEKLNESERRTLRLINCNTFTSVSDGTVYSAIHGGVSSAGTSILAVRDADNWKKMVRGYQAAFEAKLHTLMPLLEQRGYRGELEIRAELQFDNGEHRVLLPDYSIRVTPRQKS